jgi:hypothetical protein
VPQHFTVFPAEYEVTMGQRTCLLR